MPIGQMGTVKYILTSMPTTTASYIQVDFSVSTRGSPGAWGLRFIGMSHGDCLGMWSLQTWPTQEIIP